MTKIKSRRVALSSEEIDAISAHYDLGRWRVCRALGGTSSNNLLLQTNQGKKVLKRYFWSLPSTKQEHSILNHLAGTDFPTPRLAINREGLTFTELGNSHYAIYDFSDGYCYADYLMPSRTRQRIVAQAGEMLARLHQLTSGFVPEGRKFNGFRPDGKRLWRDVAWHFNVLDQYVEYVEKTRSPDEEELFLLNIVDELKRDFIEIGRHYEQPPFEFPKLMIHGDYAPHNIIFNRTGSITVLDFGDSCVDLRALDVARGLTSFSRAGRYGVNELVARAFLIAYQARQPLSDREVEAIPELIRWRYLKNIIWKLFHRVSQPSRRISPNHVRFIRDRWERARWMKAHGDEVSKALLST